MTLRQVHLTIYSYKPYLSKMILNLMAVDHSPPTTYSLPKTPPHKSLSYPTLPPHAVLLYAIHKVRFWHRINYHAEQIAE